MGNKKYQFLNFMLFDYAGVEEYLEKMAAKGWRFNKIGTFGWEFYKAEPAKVKYSVTYVPGASDFDPEPSERQKDIEAYCLEAGWRKVGNWLQMQIFISENPDAVPIETDERIRLKVIRKSMRKNFLLSHILLFLVFLMNTYSQYSMVKRDVVGYLADNSSLWLWGIITWGIILLAFDLIYYSIWLGKAKKLVDKGEQCPRPTLYRHMNKIAWGVLGILAIGLFASYHLGMLLYMVVYLLGLFGIITIVRWVQQFLKESGASRNSNRIITFLVDVILAFLLVIGVSVLVINVDVGKEERVPVSYLEYENHSWEIYKDPIPLLVEDFYETDYENYSCMAEEKESVMLRVGEYMQRSFPDADNSKDAPSIYYDVITVKADFLYDFCLKAYYEKEFRYSSEEEREKTEYRLVYENGDVKMYRMYYDNLPVAHDWLILTGDKIIPFTVYLDDLTVEQVKIIIDKLK